VKCTPLTYEQHGYCLAFGASSIIVGILIKLIPEGVFKSVKLFRENPVILEEGEESTLKGFLKKPSTLRRKKSAPRKVNVSSEEKEKEIEMKKYEE